MTTALTPALALAYLDELTVDLRAAAVVAADGGALAGDAALAARVGGLLAGPGVHRKLAPDGTLLLARGPAGAAIAVLAGDRVPLPLLEHDLGRIAEALVVPDSPS